MDAPEARFRHVEEASLNAWPALHEVLLDGWIVRLTMGFTRRANAVTPLYPGSRPLAEKIDSAEHYYRRAGLTPCFRLPRGPAPAPSLDALENALDARGYDASEGTDVLWRPLTAPLRAAPEASPDAPSERHGAGPITFVDRDAWLERYGVLTGQPASAQAVHGLILKAIQGDCLFAAIDGDDGSPVACGLGVVDDGLVGIFDLVTAVALRRRGHGRSLMTTLLDAGREHGADAAYLQVVEDNASAQALYAGLGFEHLYSYRYRSAPKLPLDDAGENRRTSEP